MPRLEINEGKGILAVAERPEDMQLKVIIDYRLKTPQMESAVVFKGKTIVIKGKYSEIRLFPEDIKNIKKLL